MQEHETRQMNDGCLQIRRGDWFATCAPTAEPPQMWIVVVYHGDWRAYGATRYAWPTVDGKLSPLDRKPTNDEVEAFLLEAQRMYATRQAAS